jgi:hypothetical protein
MGAGMGNIRKTTRLIHPGWVQRTAWATLLTFPLMFVMLALQARCHTENVHAGAHAILAHSDKHEASVIASALRAKSSPDEDCVNSHDFDFDVAVEDGFTSGREFPALVLSGLVAVTPVVHASAIRGLHASESRHSLSQSSLYLRTSRLRI